MRPTWGAMMYGFVWRHRMVMRPSLSLIAAGNIIRGVLVPIGNNGFGDNFLNNLVVMNTVMGSMLLGALALQTLYWSCGLSVPSPLDEEVTFGNTRTYWGGLWEYQGPRLKALLIIEAVVVIIVFGTHTYAWMRWSFSLDWLADWAVWLTALNAIAILFIAVDEVVTGKIIPWLEGKQPVPGMSEAELAAARASHEAVSSTKDYEADFQSIVDTFYHQS